MKFRIIALLLCLCLTAGLISGCGDLPSKEDDAKLQIVTTLFPQYDFARQLCGDRAEITLLLPPWRREPFL